MHVRRAIAIAAVAGMGLTLSACGGQDTAGNPIAASSTAVSDGGSSSSATAPTETDEASSSDAAPTSSETTSSSDAADTVDSSASGGTETAGNATDSGSAAASSAATTSSQVPTSTSGAAGSSGATTGGSGAAAESTPAWAYPGTSSGKKIGVVKNGSVQVEVYQVAVTKASKDSMLADAKTKKPLIAKGDKIVWVNYMVTNVGTKAIDLSASLVSVRAKYPDWAYLSGMAGITDSAQAKEVGVHTFGIKPGTGDSPYVFAPGQSYAVGENFAYDGAKELDLTVRVTPQGADGKLDHDHTQEFKGTVEIH